MGSSVCTQSAPLIVPSVSLPFGIQMQGVADLSKGPPNNCALLASLMVQVTPALAAFTPIITILNVFIALKKFIAKFPPDPSTLLPALEAAIELVDPLTFVPPVKSILMLIIQYLQCFISTMEGLLAVQANIDLSSAQGNPDLLASLTCASDNVTASISAVTQSLGPLGPLLQTVQPLIGIASSAGVSIPALTIPDLSGVGAQEMEQTLETLSQTLTDLLQVIEAIPG